MREMARSDPKLFLQIYKPPILIDEVQYAPELFTYIKIHIDENHNPGDFWLTGSQIYSLMRGVQESLAGRVALLHMSPLSQREITGAQCVPFRADMEQLLKEQEKIRPVDTPDLFRRLWYGSMPGLFSEGMDRNVFYSSYIATYIERDVRELSGSVDALKFNRFVTALAARCSQLLNYNALAVDADIDIQTSKNWINILETLGIIFLLHPYSNNVLKRTIKTPKVYFYDTGFVCYLTRWSTPETAEAGAMNGALLENYAVSELLKGYQNSGQEPYLYFYRDRDAKEIDIVIETDGKLHPLEIKKTALPDRKLTRAFNVIDRPPYELGTGAVLCMAETLGAFDSRNLIVPIWLI
ncbi:MAG: ATP-binding protein [Clostridia bacterium]|nr:ATP-binding protein [Clostridia bacterium]